MPLAQGDTTAAFKANVAEVIRSGRKPKQAVAIAYAERRKGKKK